MNDLIERSCAYAKEIPSSGDGAEPFEYPEDLKAIFSLGIEPYAPIGPRYGDKKEYYVLIRAQKAAKDENPSERFRQQIVSDLLMNNPNIKEISEVDSKPQKFHYAIQVEASSYDVDDIIFRMDSWAHHNGVPFGTRTYELLRYLSRDSIAGIEHTTIDEFERDFLAGSMKLVGDIRSLRWTNDQRRKIASAWQSSCARLARINSCMKYVGDFYLYLALYNFQRTSAEPDYLRNCGTAWLSLSLQLETLAEIALVQVLELKPSNGAKSVTKEEIAKAVEIRISEKTSKNEAWKEIKDYPARILAQYYDDLTGTKGRLSRFRQNLNPISKIRNWLAHTGHDGPFEDFINLRSQDWLEKFEKVEIATRRVSEALIDVARLGLS